MVFSIFQFSLNFYSSGFISVCCKLHAILACLGWYVHSLQLVCVCHCVFVCVHTCAPEGFACSDSYHLQVSQLGRKWQPRASLFVFTLIFVCLWCVHVSLYDIHGMHEVYMLLCTPCIYNYEDSVALYKKQHWTCLNMCRSDQFDLHSYCAVVPEIE